ncbi:hypothetical protein BJ165DRAFT_328137 [Panaeolus papilionaceus]|nr:hypothetical protein BJ165DRAFT_328137 [Panaeolus papilionaceus]
MADLAHQQGNEFYKKGAFESAERSYLSAYKINPSEPKYASNLSAVYYEQGQYIDSIASIVNSWRSLRVKNSVDGVPNTPSITDPLAIKLSLRFLKAKLNSIAKGLISLHDEKKKNKGKTSESNAGIEQDIQTFCAKLVENADATSQHLELQHVWGA